MKLECSKYPDIVTVIENRRRAWLGHVMWMDDKGTPKKILEWETLGTRFRGRPNEEMDRRY